MNKYFTFVAVLSIAGSPVCNAMYEARQRTEAKIIKEITSVKHPLLVACLSDNLIAIIGNHDASIWNYSNNIKITLICPLAVPQGSIPYLTVHPDKKTIAFGEYRKNLIVYNTKTKKLWEQDLQPLFMEEHMCSKPIFNSTDDTVFMQATAQQITVINYKNNVHTSYHLKTPVRLQTLHPTQHDQYLALTEQSVNILTFNNNSFSETNTITRTTFLNNNYHTGRYSSDGSMIAVLPAANEYCFIIDPKSNTYKPLEHSNTYNIWAMAFHPTSFILATLSLSPPTICYWNTKTEKLFTSTSLQLIKSSYLGNRMDFSCNGKELILIYDKKCLVLEVPFEALYQPKTKEKCTFALWLLKNYKNKNDNLLPEELTHLLTHNLLKTCKYSLTNY